MILATKYVLHEQIKKSVTKENLENKRRSYYPQFHMRLPRFNSFFYTHIIAEGEKRVSTQREVSVRKPFIQETNEERLGFFFSNKTESG